MPSFQTITPDEVRNRLENGETLFLVDVREQEEIIRNGKIPEAVHISMGDIPNKLSHFYKNIKYIIICKTGIRSEHVCYYLDARGYSVLNMVGGMNEYNGKLHTA